MTSFSSFRILLLLLLLCLPACRQQHQQEPLPPLLEVGQRHLSLEQFERELQLNYPDISGLPAAKQLQVKEQMLRQLTERELILGEAARLDVQLSPDELDTALAEIRGSYSVAEFDSMLRQAGKTPEAWVAGLKLQLLTAKVSDAVLTPQITVSDTELEEYYREHKEDFRHPTEILARQMLFPTREEALGVQQQVKDGGDFAALAQKYSHSPDSEKGGDLGRFARGQLPAEFDRVLFTLPVRQISEPVESPYGFHLFLVEKRYKAGLRSFSEVKEEIAVKLKQERMEEAFQVWLEQLREATTTVVRRELLTQSTIQSIGD
ncbi:MAG: hypothetical protein C0622_07285 [Desulfuromonas sp.]|nr:MAG: hypothetical protein C0622_07285 [Desulfuromonas sp.]